MTMTMDGTEAPMRERDGLKYPFDAKPEPGQTIEVAPGVHWVRQPLPFQLNHINVWLLEDGEGWTVVDTGIASSAAKDIWRQVLANKNATPTRVIVTHLHPDHVGLAGWFAKKFNAPLHMSRTDYLLCRTLVMDTGQPAPEDGVLFYKAAGFPDAMIDEYKKRFGHFGMGIHSLPQMYHRLIDGQEIVIGKNTWRIVVGRGHAPEHACLWCPEQKLMISGDQILPRISSNVSVFPTEPEANPLQEWLDSCAMLKKLIPDDTLILPAHNEPFLGVKTRMQALIDDHEDGLSKLLELCTTPKRAVDVFPALFRTKITTGNYGMATGESLAHLNCLIARKKLTRTRDADGIDWYARV